jgi:acyl-CoA reductase-like NAD-dependent aldehyde dehydrogenase
MSPEDILRAAGLNPADLSGGDLIARSPIDGAVTGRLVSTSRQGIDAARNRAVSTFTRWRSVPAPKRGELVRLFGEQPWAHQDALAAVVTLETGKILAEARGEVREMIESAIRLRLVRTVDWHQTGSCRRVPSCSAGCWSRSVTRKWTATHWTAST